jgi:hypothetical protein
MIDKSEMLKLSVELSAFLGAAYTFIKSSQAVNREKSLLGFAIKAIVKSPNELLSLLSQNEIDESDPNFRNISRNDLLTTLVGFVEGRVSCKTPFKSYIDSHKDIIYSKVIMEPIYSNSVLPEPKDTYVKIKQKPEFELIDEANLAKLIVKKNELADMENGLIYINSIKQFFMKSLYIDVMYKVVTFLKVILSIFRINLNLKGVKIGDKTTEYGILVNQSLTLFGRMIYDKRNKILTMDKPYFFLQNKYQFIRKIHEKLRKFQIFSFGSGVLGIIFFAMTVRRLIRLAASFKAYFANLRKELRLDKLRGLKDILTNGLVCVMCKENAKSVILKPCLHICLCKSCFVEKKPTACPTCQKPIKDSVNIFVV